MKYPKELVLKYKEFVELDEELNRLENVEMLLIAQGNTLSHESQTKMEELLEKLDQLNADIREEADIYAAETGADRDGSYDASNVFDELDEQLGDY